MDWTRLGQEFAFIGRIVDRLKPSQPPAEGFHLVQGIGDDTAVIQTAAGEMLWTSDMLIEGVHFRLDLGDPYRLGWKALAVNLSDIAAMGGQPIFALWSCAFPPECLLGWADRLVEGFLACAQQYGVQLIGGDTNRASMVVLDIGVLGRATCRPLFRSTAHAGDRLFLTGSIGGSRAGLERLLQDGWQKAEADDPAAVETHLKPIPRLREGQLAAEQGASALIDLSDGLAGDLLKLCEASGCGAILWQHALPLHPSVTRLAQEKGFDPHLFALVGGEDYELLIAVPPDWASECQQRIEAETGTTLTEIGFLTEERTLWVKDPSGQHLPLPAGWDHFGSSPSASATPSLPRLPTQWQQG